MAADGNITTSGYCRGCGHDLIRTAAPPAWKRGVDLREVARRQRAIQYLVLGLLVIVGLGMLLPIVAPVGRGLASRAGMNVVAMLQTAQVVIWTACGIISAVLVARLTLAMRFNLFSVIAYTLLSLAPCFNVLVLLSASSQASAMLKLAGLKVGLMGVSDEQVLRVLSSNRCHACGYILAPGMVSALCPECGEPTRAGDRSGMATSEIGDRTAAR